MLISELKEVSFNFMYKCDDCSLSPSFWSLSGFCHDKLLHKIFFNDRTYILDKDQLLSNCYSSLRLTIHVFSFSYIILG